MGALFHFNVHQVFVENQFKETEVQMLKSASSFVPAPVKNWLISSNPFVMNDFNAVIEDFKFR